jgi:hypothetical protein
MAQVILEVVDVALEAERNAGPVATSTWAEAVIPKILGT